ncbi:hypothetical protein TRFO_42609 [Tritrichomonas foetus]|uniref:BTB domain-containing protein n=1 Tax=Tritrichomonas foetus TaxID=1144522 RepID=A0A1J4KVV3_9EUKA|nr:hypothetical protein TRFO_42609 [Tritrichomonas foetus]|eukprot:OHT15274.1 hypothetical protein TRFO_42609 [Tritrichomonas foetus]
MNTDLIFSSIRQCTPLNTFILIHRGKNYHVNPTILRSISEKIDLLIKSGTNSYEIPRISGPINDFIAILFGENVVVSNYNCLYFLFWAEDLDIPIIINEMETFIGNDFLCESLIEFVTELTEQNINSEKYIKIISDNISKIHTKLCPIESMPPSLVSALCQCPGFEVEKYLENIIQVVNKSPQNASWFVKSINLAKIKKNSMKELLNSPFFDLNQIRNEIIAYGIEFPPETVNDKKQ